jgi:DNA-binding transcriptional LysR family regulator
MRLRHIEVFHAVYSCGSVTRAAEVLNVSQPSVSKVLAHAEQQLGYPLFDRVRGKLVPTPEAEKLFRHVDQVNESVDRLRHVAENLRAAQKGKIRVGATPAFGIDLLPGAIAAFRENNQDILFSVETLHLEELRAALLESRLDIGLAFDPESYPGITDEVLGAGRFVVLSPPGTFAGPEQPVVIPDLADLPFIELDRRGPLGRLLSAHIDSSGIRLQTVAYAETYHVAKALVAHGVGVAICDEITARSSGHADVQVHDLEPLLEFNISAIHIDQAPLSLVCRGFVDHLRDYMGRFLSG